MSPLFLTHSRCDEKTCENKLVNNDGTVIRPAKLTPAGWMEPPPSTKLMITTLSAPVEITGRAPHEGHLPNKFAPIAPRPTYFIPPQPFSLSPMVSPPQNKSMNDTRERAFACNYESCGKTYLKSSHLKAHIRVHTGKLRITHATGNYLKGFWI